MGLIFTSLGNLFRRRFTQNYPKVKPKLPPDFRGKLFHDRSKCIYCGLCEKYCPSGAIKVDKVRKTWTQDLGKCIFCAQCEETCHLMPKKDAIKMSTEFELATHNKKSLIRVHEKP